MYNYDFKKNNETIIKEVTNVNIKVNKEYYQTNFLLTEKNLLVFYDINRGQLPWGRGVKPLPELFLLFGIPKNNIKYIVEEENLFIIVGNQKINCYDFDLEKFLE